MLGTDREPSVKLTKGEQQNPPVGCLYPINCPNMGICMSASFTLNQHTQARDAEHPMDPPEFTSYRSKSEVGACRSEANQAALRYVDSNPVT